MSRILVIDDEPAVRDVISRMLASGGYEVVDTGSPRRALELLHDPGLRLVVSDIVMPGLDGFQLLEAVRGSRPSLPVLLITGVGTDATMREALARGAAGLLAKPVTSRDLVAAVSAVLERSERSEEDLRRRFVPGILAAVLGSAIEMRDHGVGGHCDRLVRLARRIGRELALSEGELEAIALGALLHDIGKIGIPDSILLKPGSLDDEERVLMRSHTVIGERLLASVPELAEVRAIVRHHHERWDGAGYPDRLAGEAIPRSARIVAVADSIEAMSARRPYRDPLDVRGILAELERGRGGQWDPAVVDCAAELIRSEAFSVVKLGHKESEPLWGDSEVATFTSKKLGELVATLLELGDDLDRHWPANGDTNSSPLVVAEADRRLEAAGVLAALRDALRAADAEA